MRTWWIRTLEYLADYVAVYGWADPTWSAPPSQIEVPERDRCGTDTVRPVDPSVESRR